MSKSFEEQVNELDKEWKENDRWDGVVRDYSAEEVINLEAQLILNIASHGAVQRNSGRS